MKDAQMWQEELRGAREQICLEKGYDTFPSEKTTGPGNIEASVQASKLLPERWMSYVDDELPVSALTIPGTHDSAAYTTKWPFVATQTMTISEQLDAGVRYFDLRCGIRDDIAEMVHGRAYLGLTLHELLRDVYAWLENHPSEGLIVQIKQDRPSQRSTIHFSEAIYRLISLNAERWRTANTTPSLGGLRGKIQLFRRFDGLRYFAFGIDVTRWQDNPTTPFTITTRNNVHITIQDHYNFPEPTTLPGLIATKGEDVTGLLERASHDDDPEHWYLNFTSAFELNWFYQVPPREVAVGGYWAFKWERGMNPSTKASLTRRTGKNRFGIVAMDFPETEEQVLPMLIMSNFEPKEKESRVFRVWAILLLLWCLVRIAAPYSK